MEGKYWTIKGGFDRDRGLPLLIKQKERWIDNLFIILPKSEENIFILSFFLFPI